jgi:MYXO-CTERM domain-containing protein
MRTRLLVPATFSALFVAIPATAATISVGPTQPMYKKPCDVVNVAKDGDTIEIDAGTYLNDTCVWNQNGLTLTGVNGRPKLDATGFTIPNQKGIWVFSKDATVENIEFSGASVPDSNGAGIRFQGLNLTVRNCFFHDNQDGILSGPPTAGQGEILIESSEFLDNGAGDGFSHNMYIGESAKFTLRGSWSHKAKVGHLVKTRAHENYILYNRITGEDGTDSYEIDVPQGGKTYVIGNLVQQGANTQNPAIITYKEEGPTNPILELYVVNNSIVNDLGKGTFVHVAPAVTTPAVIENNIFVGVGTAVDQVSAVQTTNFSGNPMFVDQANYDYHLTAGSPCVDKGTAPGMGDGYALTPTEEYLHPSGTEGRAIVNVIDIGAYELGGAVDGGAGTGGSTTTGGTGASASSSSSGAGAGGTGGAAGTGGGTTGTPGAKSGCGCGVASDVAGAPAALLVVLGWLARRRRRAS